MWHFINQERYRMWKFIMYQKAENSDSRKKSEICDLFIQVLQTRGDHKNLGLGNLSSSKCIMSTSSICWQSSFIDPVLRTALVSHELFGLEPQIDLLVGTFHRVTTMNDVPAHFNTEIPSDGAGF